MKHRLLAFFITVAFVLGVAIGYCVPRLFPATDYLEDSQPKLRDAPECRPTPPPNAWFGYAPVDCFE